MPGPEHVAGRCARLPASVYPVSQDCGGIEDWTVVRAAMYAAAPRRTSAPRHEQVLTDVNSIKNTPWTSTMLCLTKKTPLI